MTYRFSAGDRLEREPAEEVLRRFLDRVLGAGSFDLRCRIERLDPSLDAIDRAELRVLFEGPDRDLLLERHGELLEALEYLAVRALRLDPRLYDRVRFDAADFRASRLAELQLAARVAAQRVVETRQPFRFNPMPARERRVVHLALGEFPGVRSESQGQGEERQVVIFPAAK